MSTLNLGESHRPCRVCSLQELCWPPGLEPSELERLQRMVSHAGPLAPGDHLFRVGDPFTAIYAVRSGCIKTYDMDAGGHEQVHGFHLPGEVLGFDAVHPDRHRCNALILEPCSVCVVAYQDIARLNAEFQGLYDPVLRIMSREFSRQRLFADGAGAMQRIANFLLDMHTRLQPSGTAEYEFLLPMSREDISGFLGMTPETLSRLIAKLRKKRLISIDRRRVFLADPIRLGLIAQGVRQADKSPRA